ncbi:hypothetical protein MMC17_002618 [Xylographa soralifera]|nr:hypothetical protein [Xylographa soralifera]
MDIPQTYTHSLLEDLINTSRRSTNITRQASEYNLAFQKIYTLARLRQFIEIQVHRSLLDPLGLNRNWKRGFRFIEARRSLEPLAVTTSHDVMQLPVAYVAALDEAVRYTNDALKVFVEPPTLDLLTWQEQAAGTYYPERADKIKLAYREYYVNIRGTIESLLQKHLDLRENLDAVATHFTTIFNTAELYWTLSLYKSKYDKWHRSWQKYFPSYLGNRTAVIETYDYYNTLTTTFYETYTIVKQSHAELSCILTRIAIYEADVNATTNASMAVLEVQRLEWNLRQMESMMYVALELRNQFHVGVRRYEEVWVKPYEEKW